MDKVWFKYVLKQTLLHEGFFSNEKHDSGAETYRGVSLKFLKMNNIDIDGDGKTSPSDIYALNEDKIKDIYYKYFWKRGNVYEIAKNSKGDSLSIAKQVFDILVNFGVRAGSKIFQESLNIELYKIGFSPLLVDGLVGKKTLKALSKISNIERFNNNLVELRIEKYIKIITRNYKKSRFLLGWYRRSISYRIRGLF